MIVKFTGEQITKKHCFSKKVFAKILKLHKIVN